MIYRKKYKPLIAIILLMIGMYSCQQKKANSKSTEYSNEKQDTAVYKPKRADTLSANDTTPSLDSLGSQVLRLLKNKDFQQLTSVIHPALGLRFSPYGFIDTAHQQRLSVSEIISLSQTNKKIVWGNFDGSGEPILLTIQGYFDRFVNDADYLHAPKVSADTTAETSNSINNIITLYPQAHYIEFYFPGFNPKYSGMDWKALRLVFSNYKNKPYLVAVVHAQWTI